MRENFWDDREKRCSGDPQVFYFPRNEFSQPLLHVSLIFDGHLPASSCLSIWLFSKEKPVLPEQRQKGKLSSFVEAVVRQENLPKIDDSLQICSSPSLRSNDDKSSTLPVLASSANGRSRSFLSSLYIMSASPSKDGADGGDAPSDTSEMERGEEAQVREAYEFEVKEQDRWLPIANGWSSISLFP